MAQYVPLCSHRALRPQPSHVYAKSGCGTPRYPCRSLTKALQRAAPAIRQIGWTMHRYRSHTCGELRAADVGAASACRVGCTTGVIWAASSSSICGTTTGSSSSSRARTPRPTRRWSGSPRSRCCASTASCSPAARTTSTPSCRPATIEVEVSAIEVLGAADPLPFPVFPEDNANEESRLTNRFLDLRRQRMHRNILLRSAVISTIRKKMTAARLQRDGHPDPVGHLPRGRPRLPGPLPGARRQVLRAAAGPAAVQAAADDRRLRPLLPDRAVLPRRGHAAPTARPASSTSSTSR